MIKRKMGENETGGQLVALATGAFIKKGWLEIIGHTGLFCSLLFYPNP